MTPWLDAWHTRDLVLGNPLMGPDHESDRLRATAIMAAHEAGEDRVTWNAPACAFVRSEVSEPMSAAKVEWARGVLGNERAEAGEIGL